MEDELDDDNNMCEDAILIIINVIDIVYSVSLYLILTSIVWSLQIIQSR